VGLKVPLPRAVCTRWCGPQINQKLREWEDYYNYHRPHGAIEGQTPFERLIAKTRADVSQGS